MKDKKGVEITKGSIVDIHQTVNGQSLFVVLEVEPLDIVYRYDLNTKYEYDKQELLDMHTDLKEVEVVGNIYDLLDTVSQQREQLIAFSEFVVKNVTRKGHEEVVDYFLKKHKGINCG